MKEVYRKYIGNSFKLEKKYMISMIFLICIIAGFFGFIYEFIFYYFNSGMKAFYYRGGNFLPWINIYAIGATIVYLATYKIDKRKSNVLKIFLLSVLICGILELVSGYVMYTFFDGFRCWDYNTEILNFGNIGGFVCLRSVIFFGMSSLFLIYTIIPACYYIFNKADKRVFFNVVVLLFTIVMADELYNLVIARAFSLPRASDVYKTIGFKYMNF